MVRAAEPLNVVPLAAPDPELLKVTALVVVPVDIVPLTLSINAIVVPTAGIDNLFNLCFVEKPPTYLAPKLSVKSPKSIPFCDTFIEIYFSLSPAIGSVNVIRASETEELAGDF